MVSACVRWKGATKPFFVNENGLKVNAKTDKKHFGKQLFPEVDRLMNGTSWIFLQDSTPSHCSNLVFFLPLRFGCVFYGAPDILLTITKTVIKQGQDDQSF